MSENNLPGSGDRRGQPPTTPPTRMDLIKSLFMKRDRIYEAINKQIFVTISDNVLPAIEEFLMEMGVKPPEARISWEELHPSEDMIAIVGMLHLSSHTGIELLDNLDRIFFVHIPVRLAADGSKGEIVNFLRETMNRDSIQEMEANVEHVQKDSHFDIDKLSDEQKKQLGMHYATRRGIRGGIKH